MNSLLIAGLALIAYLIAYHTYGKFLSRKLFGLNKNNPVPAHQLNDSIDYIPTPKHILFGHHFTTIAGLGPIVGPAIGIIWGWLPAFLWVVFGSVLMGAVHDFSVLIISARNKGKTIGDLTGDFISPSTRFAFQFIMQLLLFIVLAVFAMIVSVLFKLYPASVFPVWIQIPIAIWLGKIIRSGKSDLIYSVIALLAMYASIYISIMLPEGILSWLSEIPVEAWCAILFIYVFIASTLPVNKLLQPRDYINSQQLIVTMLLIVIGLVVAHPVITAPAINPIAFSGQTDIPDLMPLLFIIIACGAISGFHSIASSGTSVKQLDNEQDSLFIGFGSMLTEGFLAILVLLSVAGGLGMGFGEYSGREAFLHHYSSWAAANGLAAKLEAFITGATNLMSSFGLPAKFGAPLIAVFIVSFANTTLDSAARMQRLSLQELTGSIRNEKLKIRLSNRYVSTFIVVFAAAIMTFLKPGGQGAMLLWPLFGSLNQLLAALALGVVSVYLYLKGLPVFYTLIPMLFVLVMTIWAMVNNVIIFYLDHEFLLVVISFVIFILTSWLLYAGIVAVRRKVA